MAPCEAWQTRHPAARKQPPRQRSHALPLDRTHDLIPSTPVPAAASAAANPPPPSPASQVPVNSRSSANMRCPAITRKALHDLPPDCLPNDESGEQAAEQARLWNVPGMWEFDPTYYHYHGCQCMQVSAAVLAGYHRGVPLAQAMLRNSVAKGLAACWVHGFMRGHPPSGCIDRLAGELVGW